MFNKIKSWRFYVDNCFIVINSLLGVVKMTNNVDLDNYSYPVCGISFEVCRTFHCQVVDFVKT